MAPFPHVMSIDLIDKGGTYSENGSSWLTSQKFPPYVSISSLLSGKTVLGCRQPYVKGPHFLIVPWDWV